MKPALVIVFLVCYISSCQCLKLIINRGTSASFKADAICGYVLCTEENTPSVNSTSSEDQTGKIMSMTIRKKSFQEPGGSEDGAVVVASLTRANHRQVAKTLHIGTHNKTLGYLTARKARILLELSLQDECSSDFMCEVTGVDNLGREYSNIATLVQRSDRKEHSEDTTTTQDQSLLRDLDRKIDLLTRSVDDLKFTMKAEENSSRDSIDLKPNISLHSRLDSLETSIKNTVDDLVMSQLYELNAKLSAIENAHNETNRLLPEKLETLERKLGMDNQERFQAIVNTMTSMMSSSKAMLLRDLTGAFEEIAVPYQNSSLTMMHNISSSTQQLQDNLKTMEVNLNSNVRKAQTATIALITQISLSMDERVKSVVADTITPKTCKKGMTVFPSEKPVFHTVIRPDHGGPYLCDTSTDGGGWVIIHRRATGNIDFFRGWDAYKNGFGSLYDEFWLGNDRVHELTSEGTWELRVDLRFQGKQAFAHYGWFSLSEEKDEYTLDIGPYDGNAGDGLRRHNGQGFTTYDRNNDGISIQMCKIWQHAGFLYWGCDYNLNADSNSVWVGGAHKGLQWATLSGLDDTALCEMKIRRVQ